MYTSPVENPGSQVVSPETDGQITSVIETCTNSIPDNGVVEIIDVTVHTFDNPELMLQHISLSDSWLLWCGIYLHHASGMGVDLQ
jgi:hypothetical protein